MKLHDMVDSEILADEDMQGQDYGIATEGMGMAIRAFYQYARPIDAIVREVASNCFDSHREAKIIPKMSDEQLNALGYTGDLDSLRSHFSKWKDRDIEIELVSPQKLGDVDRSIIFRDFGVGISPSRMKNIMTKFFSSTKRATDEFIGAFGLGSKSPLGYTNAFQMNTWFFGKRYEYLIHSGSAAPRLELLGVYDDVRINGTKVIVPIENESDYNDFRSAVKTQLRYFDGLTIKGIQIENSTVYRGKNFVYRNDDSVGQMHICFGKVYYPLDLDAAGISFYREGSCPIGLYFDIGELPVVWNRESIEYTVKSKEIIRNRMEAAKLELQAIWDNSFSDIKSAEQFIKAKIQGSNNVLTLPNGIEVSNVNKLIKMEIIWPNHPNVLNGPLSSWTIEKKIESGKTVKGYYGIHISELILRDVPFYFTDNNVSRPNINTWLYEDSDLDTFYLIKRKFDFTVDSDPIKNFRFKYDLGKDNWHDEADKLDFINTLKEIEEYIRSKSLGNYDDLEVPEEWSQKLRERRKLRRQAAAALPKKEIEIRAKQPVTIRPLDYEQGRHGGFSIISTTIGNLESFKATLVYGDQDDLEYLEFMAKVFGQMGYKFQGKRRTADSKIIVCKVAKATLSILDEIPNAIHVKSFMNTPSGFWRRWLTCQLLENAWPNGTEVFNSHHDVPMLNKARHIINRLRDYKYAFVSNVYFGDKYEELRKEMVKQLMLLRHWDQSVLDGFKVIVAYAWRWRILKYVNLNTIPKDDLKWVMGQVGMDNPELLYRNSKRKGLITKQQTEEKDT